MNFHETQNFFKLVLNPFTSGSLITEDGKLLASCDQHSLQSTTSRLVVFQIMKKYLNPQTGDLFILNDPENGGLSYQNVFFVTRLTEKLYLVFVAECTLLNFKIPPTPLFEKGAKNKTIWPFLVDQQPEANTLSLFFELQWERVRQLNNLAPFIQIISNVKNQQSYFKIVQQIFERQFGHKAIGQSEVVYKITPADVVKLKLAIDEKQNQRTIYADFSQSSGPLNFSAASHIIESCLIKSFADHYGMTDVLSQPLLDRIRLTLPPQSIVSKAHPQGLHNLLLQKIVSEQVIYILTNLAGSAKKTSAFKLMPEFKLDFKVAQHQYKMQADGKKFNFAGLDSLIQSRKIIPLIVQNSEGKIKLKVKINTKEPVSLIPTLVLADHFPDFIMHAGKAVHFNSNKELKLNADDLLEFNWKLNEK